MHRMDLFVMVVTSMRFIYLCIVSTATKSDQYTNPVNRFVCVLLKRLNEVEKSLGIHQKDRFDEHNVFMYEYKHNESDVLFINLQAANGSFSGCLM